MDFSGRLNCHGEFVQIDRYDVACFDNVAKAIHAFARIKFAGRNGIAKENARKTLRQHDPATCRTERDGSMFARTAAAEVASAHHDGIIAVHLSRLDEADWVKRVRQP